MSESKYSRATFTATGVSFTSREPFSMSHICVMKREKRTEMMGERYERGDT